MSNEELSYTFDLLYQNITSNQAPGLNSVEKSTFLTQAQLQLVREYANPRFDQIGRGYDGNNKRQYDFSSITRNAVLEEIIDPVARFDKRAKVYTFPSDWFLALNEQLTLLHTVNNNTSEELVTVKPISLSEYDRLMGKPYKYPDKGQAWRLITSLSDEDITIAELITTPVDNTYTVEYRMRYIKKPAPIILEDISDYDVTIDGQTGPSECELPEETHREIVERAVLLAKSVWFATTIQQPNNQRERD